MQRVATRLEVNERIRDLSSLFPASRRLRLNVLLLREITDVELQARTAQRPDWLLRRFFIGRVDATSNRL